MSAGLQSQSDGELQSALDAAQDRLETLRQYNGTAPGARAIASTRDEIDSIMREVGRRMTERRNSKAGA